MEGEWVHLYLPAMHHLPHVLLASDQPGGSGPPPIPTDQLYLLGGIFLGAAMLLVILVVITGMRRSSLRRPGRPPSPPKAHPLHSHEIDPWRESARRLDTDSSED